MPPPLLGFQPTMSHQPFFNFYCSYKPYPNKMPLVSTPELPRGRCFTPGSSDFPHSDHFSRELPPPTGFIIWASPKFSITTTETTKFYAFLHHCISPLILHSHSKQTLLPLLHMVTTYSVAKDDVEGLYYPGLLFADTPLFCPRPTPHHSNKTPTSRIRGPQMKGRTSRKN